MSRKTDGDALYTNSVLALDGDTGELAWYFQFVPGETLDLDEVFESVLIDHHGRRSLFKMGKHGIAVPVGEQPHQRGLQRRAAAIAAPVGGQRVHPSRYSSSRNAFASGTLVTRIRSASHSMAAPLRTARLPSSTTSVNGPA